MRPSAPNAAQVKSFETQQQLQARRDAEDQQRQRDLAAAMQQLQAAQAIPGPEASGAPPMTPAQRAARRSMLSPGSPLTSCTDVGTIHKVCANSNCPVHHPKQTRRRDEARWKVEQEKQRRDQAIANATDLRVLSAIATAVPVRLLKRHLFFIVEKLIAVLEEPRIETLAHQHGIRQKRDEGGIAKTLLAYMRRADESTLSQLMVETTILLAASRHNGTTVLKDAATLYKVDTEAYS